MTEPGKDAGGTLPPPGDQVQRVSPAGSPAPAAPPALGRGELDRARLAQGPAAVLSLSRAAELLPVGRARGRRWLLDRGLVRRLDGAPVVVWSAVLAELAAPPPVNHRTTSPRRQSPPAIPLDPE